VKSRSFLTIPDPPSSEGSNGKRPKSSGGKRKKGEKKKSKASKGEKDIGEVYNSSNRESKLLYL
jgi:hypothetical protein